MSKLEEEVKETLGAMSYAYRKRILMGEVAELDNKSKEFLRRLEEEALDSIRRDVDSINESLDTLHKAMYGDSNEPNS